MFGDGMVMKAHSSIEKPNHVAVILDGNRRWARKHSMPVWMGHRYGGRTAEKFLDWCIELDVPQVSLWVSSTENFGNRTEKEVEELLNVYYKFLKKWEKKQPIFDKYEIKVRFVGNLSQLPPKMVKLMGKIMQKTAKYQKKVLNILVNYGGMFEIKETMKKIAAKVIKAGKIEIIEKDIENNLLVPAPIDLVIRTGGYKRLSNFMMWQIAYAEIYFTKTLWPDFTKKELVKSIKWFGAQKKNFGV